MSSGYKLYPPIIGESIPAFYEENGTAVIAVPFSVNRAVDVNDIVGLKIKIKTVQSNILLKTIDIVNQNTVRSMINNRIAKFEWQSNDDSFSKISIGQFLKIQIAFLSAANNSSGQVVTGYFSNVGIVKFTSKPDIYILNGEAANPNGTAIYKMNYVGVYNTQEDISERPYSYCFTLYDSERNVIESSGWKLHNSSITYTVSESLSVGSVIDTYSYTSSLIPNEIYYIQYSVRTINNLEVHSPIYSCMDIPVGKPTLQLVLKAENQFDDGYISINFALPVYKYLSLEILQEHEAYQYWNKTQYIKNNSDTIIPGYYFLTEDCAFDNIQILSTENYDASVIKNTLKNSRFPWMNTTETIYLFLKSFKIIALPTDDLAKTSRLLDYQDHLNLLIAYLEEYVSDDIAKDQILSNPISLAIERSDQTSNYTNWQVIQQKYFTTYTEMIDNWNLKDFTVEQGTYYKYAIRQFNDIGIMTKRSIANFGNSVMADFEDMFLYDGKKQLKIRFNPKVTSFKTTQLEQKIETLGSRFPYIFKNGVVNYKEFPISGLISYNSDTMQLFIDYKNDLGIIVPEDINRETSPTDIEDVNIINYFDNLVNTYSTASYNMRAERIFKIKVLEWLNDGNIKLFKSPAEGNYLVRLMNVSFAPEDKLGRMLHTFTAQAYEIEELTFENLKNLGFIDGGNNGIEEQILTVESVNVYDKFIKPLTTKPDRNSSFSINGENSIINYLIFEPTENTETINGVNFRIGGNSSQNKVLVFTHAGLDLSVSNAILPDVYFNIYDNIENMNNNQPTINDDQGSNTLSDDSPWDVLKNALQTLLSDIVVTYGYYSKNNRVGQLGNVKNVYIQNKIQTHIGPWQKTIPTDMEIPIEGSGSLEQILKYIVLDFYEKKVIDLTYDSRTGRYYNSNHQSVPMTTWDPLCIYRIMRYSQDKPYTTDIVPQPETHYYQLVMQNDIPYYEEVSNLIGVDLSNYYAWGSSVDQLYASSGDGFSSIRTTGINTSVIMTLIDGTTITTQKPPVVLNLNNQYSAISFGNGVYLQSAYQSRIVEYLN